MAHTLGIVIVVSRIHWNQKCTVLLIAASSQAKRYLHNLTTFFDGVYIHNSQVSNRHRSYMQHNVNINFYQMQKSDDPPISTFLWKLQTSGTWRSARTSISKKEQVWNTYLSSPIRLQHRMQASTAVGKWQRKTMTYQSSCKLNQFSKLSSRRHHQYRTRKPPRVPVFPLTRWYQCTTAPRINPRTNEY